MDDITISIRWRCRAIPAEDSTIAGRSSLVGEFPSCRPLSAFTMLIWIKKAVDTASGLTYLHEHSPPVCHADLKGVSMPCRRRSSYANLCQSNILVKVVDRIAVAVLCDFGLAKLLEEPSVTSVNLTGTVNYMSPELLEDSGEHSLQSDIWAWGCVLLEVATLFV